MSILKSIYDGTKDHSLPYLLFTVGENIYGINSEFVQSIERLEGFTTIVDSMPTVRGGVIFQENFIYLIDMRKVFGLESQIEEFERSVQPEQRIKDHEIWVSALERSILDRTEFLLTDDPHQCAFGRWYYSFETDNYALKHQLQAIELPHEAIHNTAVLVREFVKEGNYDSAMTAIKEMRSTHFKKTLHILSNLRELVLDTLKELYIVVNSGNYTNGLIVDSIVGVEHINNIFQKPVSLQNIKHMHCLGRRENDDNIIIILNIDPILMGNY